MSKIAYLSPEMHDRLLGRPRLEIPRSKLREAEAKWEKYGVETLADNLEPIDIFIPEEIPTASECIKLSHDELRVERVISRLEAFSRGSIPEIPENIPSAPGWWLYESGSWVSGSYPTAVTAVFDFETVEIDGKPYPVCASVVSQRSWWLWIGDITNLQPVIEWGRNSLLIGHQASYDRSFLAGEYEYQPTGCLFPCTMSMWIATHAYGSQQGGLVRSKREDLDFVPDWLEETGGAGLDDVYKFFTGEELDKGVVKELVKGGMEWLTEGDNFERLVAYNLRDVKATFEIFCYLWPEYRLAYHNARVDNLGDLMIYADLLQGKSWLPMSADRWPTWCDENENRYQEIKKEISRGLRDIAEKVLGWLSEITFDDEGRDLTEYQKQILSINHHGWQDVTIETYKVKIPTPTKERMKELRSKVKDLNPRYTRYLDRVTRSISRAKKHKDEQPYLELKLKRYAPEWYKKVLDGLTLGSRITPLLIGATWLGKPLYWEDGWMYLDDNGEPQQVPHPEERGKKVSNLFMQGMGTPIRQGVLSSQVDTKEVMKLLSQSRLWTSFGKRFSSIRTNLVKVKESLVPVWITQDTRYPGTISYRASGMTQLLPNKHAVDKDGKHIYSDKLGCSIKAQAEAPPGYIIVGADLNSQELGLFAAIGDALAGFHGSQPGSLMCLLGSKADKTTLHWILALKAQIEYGLAKNCIYGAIYGLAVKGLKDYFMKANVTMPEPDAEKLAKETLDLLLGINDYGVLRGGLLSDSFNRVRKLANSPVMETVICGRKISKALRNLGKDYKTTRVNWMVQSAGSDQRCLMVVWMHWLLKKYNIDARLITPIHDEFRYCVNQDQIEDFNWAFQLCHVMMQAFTVDRLGLDGITCNHAYFTGVDVDPYLRKSVDDPVHTICNPAPLPLGRELRPIVLKDFIPSFAR